VFPGAVQNGLCSSANATTSADVLVNEGQQW